MKEIYMVETLQLIAESKGENFANEIVAKGEIKETEEGVKYLKIIENENK